MNDPFEALRVLKLALEAQDREIKRLTVREATLDDQVEKQEQRAALAKEDDAAKLREIARLTDLVTERTAQVENLGRRVADAEQRALLFERQCDTLRGKADRHDRLEEASTELLNALNALPLDMKDATIVPGAHRPKIELYGTYDWQNVMDAKFALVQAMKKER